MKKIIRMSRILKWIAYTLCFALIINEAGLWITGGFKDFEPYLSFEALPQFNQNLPTSWEEINPLQRFLGFLVSLIPLSFTMTAFVYLGRLMRSFQHLELFETKNVILTKKIGWMLIGGQLVHPFYIVLLSLILTYNNPVGERVVSIGFGNEQIAIIIIGLAIFLVSWILEQASKLHEDQLATI